MKIIISPAKKMNTDTDSLPWLSLPQFLPNTKELYTILRSMSYEELKALWKCNDKLAKLNMERLQNMDLESNLTPAILSYEGIQYQYMAPGVFTDAEFEYIQDKLRILSGFYGLLRPFDGVSPYRLEMQAKLKTDKAQDLYSYWSDTIAKKLFEETDCIINLASKEYSKSVEKYLTPSDMYITCTFCEMEKGKLVQKGTYAKMARGEMVRFMAEKQIKNPEEIKEFHRLGYVFRENLSCSSEYVFERVVE